MIFLNTCAVLVRAFLNVHIKICTLIAMYLMVAYIQIMHYKVKIILNKLNAQQQQRFT